MVHRPPAMSASNVSPNQFCHFKAQYTSPCDIPCEHLPKWHCHFTAQHLPSQHLPMTSPPESSLFDGFWWLDISPYDIAHLSSCNVALITYHVALFSFPTKLIPTTNTLMAPVFLLVYEPDSCSIGICNWVFHESNCKYYRMLAGSLTRRHNSNPTNLPTV